MLLLPLHPWLLILILWKWLWFNHCGPLITHIQFHQPIVWIFTGIYHTLQSQFPPFLTPPISVSFHALLSSLTPSLSRSRWVPIIQLRRPVSLPDAVRPPKWPVTKSRDPRRYGIAWTASRSILLNKSISLDGSFDFFFIVDIVPIK